MASSFQGLAAELSPSSRQALDAFPLAILLPHAAAERRWVQDELAGLVSSGTFATVGELLRRGDVALAGREYKTLREAVFGVVRRLDRSLRQAREAGSRVKAEAPGPRPRLPSTLPSVLEPKDGPLLDAWAAENDATALLLRPAAAFMHLFSKHVYYWSVGRPLGTATIRELALADLRRFPEVAEDQAALLALLRDFPARRARARAHDEAWRAARPQTPRRAAWVPLIDDLFTLRERLLAENVPIPLRLSAVEGQYIRREVDAVLAGPYGPIVLSRAYNSRRATNDADLGVGWTHSFAVYLQVMPSGDDRILVETGSGQREFFRCDSGTTDRSCVSDDHRPRGNLRRVSSAWFYYPGDGTVWKFRESTYNGRQPWQYHQDASGYTLADSLVDANGRVTRVSSANSSVYLSFSYGSAGLDAVRISSDSVNQILDYDVIDSGFVKLDRVKFASAVNTIDADTVVIYTYDGSQNLTTVQKKVDASTTVTVASATYDGSDRATSLKSASLDLTFAWTSATLTSVTYNIEVSGNPSTVFTRDGLWVRTRSSVDHVGGMGSRTQVRDDHGRVTCRETDDSRMTKVIYGDSTAPTRVDVYGKAGDCTSGGTVDRQLWYGYTWNDQSQGLRTAWTRHKSIYNGASDCSGSSRPAGCTEVAYTYVSSTDGRVQWVTETGTTRLVSGSTVDQVRKQRTFFYGLDAGVCTSGDAYTGLPCREEDQDNSGNVLTRVDFTYIASGASAGWPKTVAVHDKASDPAQHTTTYASHNLFGTPTSVTSPTGVVTTYAFNGWNAPTSVTETGALLDSTSPTPGTLSPVTTMSYNKLRRVETVTLPKSNQLKSIYETTGETFARLRAQATADASGNLLEITRYVYDRMGNRIEDRILDSISGTTPCADESCTTYDLRRERKFNALRQVTEAYLHAADQSSPPDGTKSYTYTNGQLTQVADFLGTNSSFTYDDQGRQQASARDTAGINASTLYTYDLWGRTATVTSPTSVGTTYETDDFGQRVIERSRTTGEARFEYDAKGALTKKRRSVFKSTTSTEDTCYTTDWMSRQLTVDWDCNSANDWTLSYDGDTEPSSACPTGTKQTGHLSKAASNGFTRVLCYHPNGNLYASYQRDSATWSNTVARGLNLIYDLNGNLSTYFTNISPSTRNNGRQIEYVYDSTLKDRVSYLRHKLTSAGSWTEVTSSTTLPTYFANGGLKTVRYSNGITETNTRDIAGRLTRRRTDDGTTVHTDINLTYDLNGNITLYDDSSGLRHHTFYAAVDKLDRLRCLSRASISSCTGTKPWESKFTESFDYDASGNRTARKSSGFSADDENYAYVSGPTDIIDKVTVNSVAKEQSNTFKGQINATNIPGPFAYTYDREDHLANSNDNSLGNVGQYHTLFADRYARQSTCNARRTYYYSMPAPETGSSQQTAWINLYNTCLAEFPRQLHTYLWLEDRPIAVVRSEIASGTDAQTELATYWIHADHLGTPVLVTQSDKTERWRWENDPFGRGDPVEYTVSPQDVSPDDDASSGSPLKYNTCCCGGGGCGAGCNLCQTGCSAGQCTGGGSQDVIWQKTYSVLGANNVRLHFSTFDVAAGSTRTGKDYVRLVKGSDGTTVISDLTGNLGDFWGPWAGVGESSAILKLYADNVQDNTRGFVVDKLEYTTATNGRFVMHLRMPGQVWDEEAKMSQNYHRWYRREDGRYLTPDPIGLEGGEPGYFGYAGGSPLVYWDPSGLAGCAPGWSTATCDSERAMKSYSWNDIQRLKAGCESNGQIACCNLEYRDSPVVCEDRPCGFWRRLFGFCGGGSASPALPVVGFVPFNMGGTDTCRARPEICGEAANAAPRPIPTAIPEPTTIDECIENWLACDMTRQCDFGGNACDRCLWYCRAQKVWPSSIPGCGSCN